MILDVGAKACPCVPASAYHPPLASRAWRIKMIQMMITRRAPRHPAYASCCTLSASMTGCNSWQVAALQKRNPRSSGSHTRQHHVMIMKTVVNAVSPVSVAVWWSSQQANVQSLIVGKSKKYVVRPKVGQTIPYGGEKPTTGYWSRIDPSLFKLRSETFLKYAKKFTNNAIKYVYL